jgi:DNA primase
MDRQKMKALLRELGITAGKHGQDFKDSKDNIQFNCPFHGETRPSAGIHVYDEFGKCFSCGEHFNLVKLVAHCMEWNNSFKDSDGKTHSSYDYKRAEEWLEEKYNVEKREVSSSRDNIVRIEDDVDNSGDNVDKPTRYETPRLKLALYKSGKAVHDYFFERGFTKETAKKFLVGWDEERKRITTPVMWEDNEAVCGFIGRAVLEMKIKKNGEWVRNPKFYKVYKESEKNDVKYYIYDGFPVGDILFPLPHFRLVDDMAVLVEGQYDCMWQHQNGFPQFLSTLGSKLVYEKRLKTSKQIELLHKLGAKKILLMRDLDKAGQTGNEHDYGLLKHDFRVFTTDYPEGKTDPQQITKKEMDNMLGNMYPYGQKRKGIIRLND